MYGLSQTDGLRPLLAAYEAMRAGGDGAEPAGPRQTLEAGIDHVRASVRAWERIAREA